MSSFSVLLVELYSEGNQVDALQMFVEEVVQMGERAINEICNRAGKAVAPKTIKCLTYDDDEGDACTLTKDTLTDALSFAFVLDETIGVLRLQVKCAPEASPPIEKEVVSDRKVPSAMELSTSAVTTALNNLAQGLDLRHLVPKLAEVALNIVAHTDEPALFALIDTLTAFREGIRTADDLPNALPEILAVLCSLPESARLAVLAQARAAAELVVEELKQTAPRNAPVEVHAGVVCDGCNCSPIVGPRYQSLEKDDFDLCATCYGREDRKPEAWVQVRSDLRGDVISSFFGPTGQSSVHYCVQCDECGQSPIVGRRFKVCGENFDLCGACMETWNAGSKVGTKTFEEISITTAAKVVSAEEQRATKTTPEKHEAVHYHVVCDGCEMCPVVGRRFKACGEDYDLCNACMENWNASPQSGTKMFEEVILPSPAPQLNSEENEDEAPPPETFDFSAEEPCQQTGESLLEKPTASACQMAITALLQHSSAEVRAAVQEALAVASNIQLPTTTTTTTATDTSTATTVSQTLPFVPPSREVLNYDVFPTDQLSPEDDNSTVVPEEPEVEDCVESDVEVKPRMSAKVLSSADLMLGIEAYEDATVRGDVTAELADIVAACGATHAHRIGRVIVTTVDDATAKVPACAKIVVFNDGEVPWPETAAISIALGPHYDFPHMELGALQVGEGCEIVMDLAVPASTLDPTRSVWAIIDSANGAVLGPILCFEVVHE